MDSSSSSSSEDPCTNPQLQRMGSGGSSVVLDPETGAEAESRKLPSSQYKGVVPQPNGRWGAQIYEKHQRVWLGTFDSEPAAARSYDVAAQRFRGRDAVTNFTPLSASNPSDATELEFLARHSKAEIVDMLRKHTYADELRQSGLTFSNNNNNNNNDKMAARPSSGGGASASREHLFDKTVTPSDVGKLNRLVIPKQHAERHLPVLRDGGPESVLISFEDAGDGKVWRFRYSYWNSSQSYVLTKGWSRFVKEKGLVAGDTVRFLRDKDGGERKLYVECRSTTNGSEGGAKVVRLFGVDIFRGGGEMMMKRKRDLDLDQAMESSRFFKKEFVGVL